ncbi:MAG: CAAX amino protease [Melioribacteraceae bacterium]|nr:MAG: CAAX amino protease [Melioribacteraceae bacterium]
MFIKEKNIIWLYSALIVILAFLAGFIHKAEIGESSAPTDSGLGMLIWITSPLLLGILFTFLSGKKWSDFRISFKTNGSGLWWSVALLIYPVIFILVYTVGITTGDVVYNSDKLPQFFEIMLMSVLFSTIKNIFEEFAWRGYLAPKVYRNKWNIYIQHIFVGLIWGIWHIPFLSMFWPYVNENNIVMFVIFFLFGAIAHSVVYGELRIKTDSVVPAWLMHNIGSVFGTAFLTSGIFSISQGYEMIYSPGTESLIGSIVMLITGRYLINKRIRKEFIDKDLK